MNELRNKEPSSILVSTIYFDTCYVNINQLQPNPTIKPLYISGHAEVDVCRGRASLSAAFLQKPFTMGMLIDKVRAVLDGAAAPVARR